MADGDTIPLYVSKTTERKPLKRIRRFSRPFEVGFAALAIGASLMALLIVIMSFAPGGPYVFFTPDGGWLTTDLETVPEGAVAFIDLPLSAKIVGLVALAFGYGTKVTGFLCLSRLFGFYRRGLVFDAAAVRIMRTAGVFLVLAAAAPGLMQPFLRVAGSIDENWFHTESVALLLVGAALVLFAQIMSLGMEIERENRGFI
ncbi:MAG: hypothetical protein GKS03_14730 [Alphaproteobacteria bacterium]|nr:hypothetical protein [Alphaproteobacteria bacterium]